MDPRVGNPNWKPGLSGNPNGRPVGSRNKRTAEIIQQIIEAGHKDPLVTLSELQATDPDPSIRATAANMLAPYLHSKLAAKPQPPDPVYIEQAISLPRPTSITLALENISKLSEMKSLGHLDIATADSLIADNRVILDALIDEAKLLASTGDPNRPQEIHITGGLPRLPGTSITMPSDPPYQPGFQDPADPPKANGGDPTAHDHTHASPHNEPEAR